MFRRARDAAGRAPPPAHALCARWPTCACCLWRKHTSQVSIARGVPAGVAGSAPVTCGRVSAARGVCAHSPLPRVQTAHRSATGAAAARHGGGRGRRRAPAGAGLRRCRPALADGRYGAPGRACTHARRVRAQVRLLAGLPEVGAAAAGHARRVGAGRARGGQRPPGRLHHGGAGARARARRRPGHGGDQLPVRAQEAARQAPGARADQGAAPRRDCGPARAAAAFLTLCSIYTVYVCCQNRAVQRVWVCIAGGAAVTPAGAAPAGAPATVVGQLAAGGCAKLGYGSGTIRSSLSLPLATHQDALAPLAGASPTMRRRQPRGARARAGDHAAREPGGHLAGRVYGRRGAAQARGDRDVLAPRAAAAQAHRRQLHAARGAPGRAGSTVAAARQVCIGKGSFVAYLPAAGGGRPRSHALLRTLFDERPIFSSCRCSLALPARAQTRMCLSCMCIHSATCRAARDGSSAAAQPRMTMARTIKLFKLPAEPVTPGLRPMEQRDIPQARPAAAALSAHGAARACRAMCAVPPGLTLSWAHAPQHAAVYSRSVIFTSFQHPPVLQHGPGTSLARSPYPADPQCVPPCLVHLSFSLRGRLKRG